MLLLSLVVSLFLSTQSGVLEFGAIIALFVKEGRKERNVLLNDALNTFYVLLYGVRHMVNDHSDSERGNALPPHELLFPFNSKGSHRQDSTYHGLCCTCRGALAGCSSKKYI